MSLKKIFKLLKIIKNSSYRPALLQGVAAGIEHEKLLRSFTCRTVIDIGANHGQFSLVAHSCLPDATIISFEPMSKPASTFRKVFTDHSRVTLYESAIGPDNNTATIHVSGKNDSSSLLPISPLQNTLFPGTSEVRQETVKIAPLASFIRSDEIISPALLKIDVQGFELQALKGCEELLSHFDYFYIECSFMELYSGQAFASEIIDYLNEKEIRLMGIYNIFYNLQGQAVQGDFFFRK